MMRIAINGFGRIGRNFFRCFLQDKEAQKLWSIPVINIGNAQLATVAHMFKYDTLMGTYPGSVSQTGDLLSVDGKQFKLIAELDAQKLPWKSQKIDWVVDCSGKFTLRDRAILHCTAGASHVLISAPANDEDITIIPGVNMEQFNAKKHKIVSLGSCTTNALVPLLDVIHKTFTITESFMNTVHAYTNSQVLLDIEQKDLRRARAAALNIIPTTSGATDMVEKVLPELRNKIAGIALRVPVAKVSFIDLSFLTQKPCSVDSLHAAFSEAQKKRMRGIIDIIFEPLVSSDFSLSPFSVTIDGSLTTVCGKLGKIFGWYDNEWGYSMRMKDFISAVADRSV